MRIKQISSCDNNIQSIVLFMEDKKEDYLFAHQLALTDDMRDNDSIAHARLYKKLPDSAITSSRTCAMSAVNIKIGEL